MNKVICYRIRYLFLCFFIHLFLITSNNLQALDSTAVFKTVMYIGHFNNDSAKDTLIGKSNYKRNFIPSHIIWGKGIEHNNLPDSLRKDSTKFSFPQWKKMKVSTNIDKINMDTLPDIILILSGKLQIDTANTKDTAAAYIIFGCSGLDTVRNINVINIDTFQITPFAGMRVRMGYELTNCKIRDFTNTPSYSFNKVNYPPIILTKEKDNENISDNLTTIKVFPNPASFFTNVELDNIKPGNYVIQLLNVNSSLVKEQKIQTKTTGRIEHILNLENIPSGCYFLKLSTEEAYLGTYQIIIIH